MKKKNKKKNKNDGIFDNLKRRFIKVKSAIFDDIDGDNENNLFTIFEVIIIIVISILFGGVLGYIITYSKLPSSRSADKVQEIVSTYNNIIDNYYEDVDQDKLVDAAVKGMIESLEDPYSNYMDKNTTDEFNESVDGSFVGIGVVVLQEEDNKKIIEITNESPAEESGLQENDIIIKVDDIDVTDMDSSDFVKLVRGKKGTKVKLTIIRDSVEKDVELTRRDIEIENVKGEVINYEDKNIGYIKISSFASNSYKQFKSTLDNLEKKKIDALVVDLRDNPGGHLSQTRQMLSLFFNKKTILYQLQSKNSSKKKVYSQSDTTRSYPVAVVINGGSASASEIFASCFKDNYKNAIIIGTTSYGKGTVQKSESLTDGTSIKYTTQKWLTSKGKWLNDKGLKPNIILEQSDEYYENPSNDLDVQLQEALKQLKESI